MMKIMLLLVVLTSVLWAKAVKDEPKAQEYVITAYCACKKCCGPKAQGLTASGKRVKTGMVACNHLDFKTKVKIEGLGVYTVEDRGAVRLFGTKDVVVRRLDVYMESHQEALKFGKQKRKVVVYAKE